MSAEIPIRNIYALLAFHWRALGIEGLRDVGQVDADTPLELLARVLVEGTRAQLRRGLDRAYIEHDEDLAHLRGAFDLDATVRRGLIVHQRLNCRFDELVPDTPANRLVKAGLSTIAGAIGVPLEIRRNAMGLAAQLASVTDVPLATIANAKITVPRSARAYAPLFDICRMLARLRIPDQALREHHFRDLRVDDRELAHLFEGFVRGFVRYHAGPRHQVGVTHPPWADAVGDAAALALLPRMKTDVTVASSEAITVLETKFVRQPFRQLEDPERIKLRSGHLYQLFAYLTNLGRSHRDRTLRGALVYASVGRGVQVDLTLGEHGLAIRTVDLTLAWPKLEAVMLSLASWAAAEENCVTGSGWDARDRA